MSSPDDHDRLMIGLPDPDRDPAHARLRAVIGATGADLVPRPGWEAKVWAKIDADVAVVAQTGAGRRAWWLGGTAVVAAAAVLLLWGPWRDRAPSAPPAADLVAVATPTISIRKGPEVMRGTTAAPGDAVEIRHAVTGGAVWVFEGDALRLACDAAHPGDGVCRRDVQGVFATVRLDRIGTYHVVTAQGATVSGRIESLDDLMARLTRAGIGFRHEELDVR